MSATYFYHVKHGARLFADGKAPSGWSDTPHKGQHPHEIDPLGLNGTPSAATPSSEDGDDRRKRK